MYNAVHNPAVCCRNNVTVNTHKKLVISVQQSSRAYVADKLWQHETHVGNVVTARNAVESSPKCLSTNCHLYPVY